MFVRGLILCCRQNGSYWDSKGMFSLLTAGADNEFSEKQQKTT